MAKIIGKNTSGDAPGHFKDYAGGPVEPGYLLCDGTSYLVATYPVLFSKIGYIFGGVGANFNVPNSNGRSHVGKGTYTDPTSGSVLRTLGQSSGAEAHILTTAQLASHTHPGTTNSDGSHTHLLRADNGSGANNAVLWDANNDQALAINFTNSNVDGAHAHAFTTNGSGSDNSHNNMHPYLVVTKMIKY